jgi:hypothetical protein
MKNGLDLMLCFDIALGGIKIAPVNHNHFITNNPQPHPSVREYLPPPLGGGEVGLILCDRLG